MILDDDILKQMARDNKLKEHAEEMYELLKVCQFYVDIEMRLGNPKVKELHDNINKLLTEMGEK